MNANNAQMDVGTATDTGGNLVVALLLLSHCLKLLPLVVGTLCLVLVL